MRVSDWCMVFATIAFIVIAALDLFVIFSKCDGCRPVKNGKDSIPKIKVKYFDKEIDKIKKITNGDWIDLRSAETVELKKGDFHLIPLGVGMKLPEGYEANIVPRSSTYKNFKVLQTNCFAVIDNSYSGDNDQWFYPVIAMEDTVIHKNDRICQFRINKKMSYVEIEEVESLDGKDRGGFGSTGKQ